MKLVCATVFVFLVVVQGHGLQQNPTPRARNNDNVREAPCGEDAGDPVVIRERINAGVVSLQFKINANHGGYAEYFITTSEDDVFDGEPLEKIDPVLDGRNNIDVDLSDYLCYNEDLVPDGADLAAPTSSYCTIQWIWNTTDEGDPYLGCSDIEIYPAGYVIPNYLACDIRGDDVMLDYELEVGDDPVAILCPPGCSNEPGTVWGCPDEGEPLTSDSSVCLAAQFVTGDDGGVFAFVRRPGHEEYTSCDMNGITSQPFPSGFDRSFEIQDSSVVYGVDDGADADDDGSASVLSISLTCIAVSLGFAYI